MTVFHPKVVIVADNASAIFGGESLHPLRYFRIMLRKGVDVMLVTHARNRNHLSEILGDDVGRVVFVPDSKFYSICHRLYLTMPPRIANFTIGLLDRMVTQIRAARIARNIVRDGRAQVVFQPMPISPKEISFVHGMGAPVVIGPLDGGMRFPPAFGDRDHPAALIFIAAARRMSHLLHWLVPGKIRADVLLVSNERTRRGLPRGVRGRVIEFNENGVELDIWQARPPGSSNAAAVRFTYMGRLVDWKAVDVLIKAFSRAAKSSNATLEIIGDGPLRGELEALAASLGVNGRVQFRGWMLQSQAAERLRQADVFVLPSLYECGGAVVLEAMAVGIPVIATRWGGPADYVNDECGILVEPSSEEALIDGIATAMTRLGTSPELRQAMGNAGRRRIEERFSWEQKVDDLLGIFRTLKNRDVQPV